MTINEDLGVVEWIFFHNICDNELYGFPPLEILEHRIQSVIAFDRVESKNAPSNHQKPS